MKIRRNLLLLGFIVSASWTCLAQAKLVEYVDTKIGVIGTRASNCVIGPQLPFGCINPSPQSPKASSSGYNPKMPTRGFGQLHVSGTGGASRYGHFLISPQIGINVKQSGHDSPAQNIETKAYFFKTFLERYGITTEISPARHSAIYRFTFPKSDSSSIVIDATQSLSRDIVVNGQVGEIHANSIEIDQQKRIIRGMIDIKAGWGCVTPYKFYFVAFFNKPVQEAGVWKDSTLYQDQQTAVRDIADLKATQRIGTYCRFKTKKGEQILMKVAVSLTSFEKAEEFLQTEIPDWNFEKVKNGGINAWEKQLVKIKLEGISPEQKKLFYTAMYHTMVMPRDQTGDNPHWTSNRLG